MTGILATYEIHGGDAERRTEAIAVEQSHELPTAFAPPEALVSLGRVVSVVGGAAAGAETPALATIEYPADLAAGELTQLLVVLIGNSSLQAGVRLVDVALPESLAQAIGGPRLGVSGVRRLVGAASRPLVATALKPVGTSSQHLAQLAYDLALGGLDLIKDDQGVSNQHWAPFAERVPLVADAVRRANAETGGNALYLPTISGADALSRAAIARDAGVGGALVMPGIDGYSAPRAIGDVLGADAVVLQHPSFLGGFTASHTHGIAPELLFGPLARLAGADVVVFPNSGGRFGLTPSQCSGIAVGAAREFGGLAPALPAPGGGMSVERVPEMVEHYGRDVVLLIGGDLHRDGDPRAAAERFRAAADAAS